MNRTSLRTIIATISLAALTSAAHAQIAPPKPTPEQLAAAFKEDQLSDEKCGIPRNAADDYRPAPLYPDQTRATRVTGKQKFKVETVASGLPNPWALAFLPSGNMLVNIRAGGMRVVTPAGQVTELLDGTPSIKTPIRLFGMHDVILDKDFKKNRTIYLAYVTEGRTGTPNTGFISSAKLSADERSITDLKVLKEGGMVPRRIAQMKDGTLMIVTAEVVNYPNAQSLKSPNGKVLRINTDGSIPKDNPFVKTADADPSVYALGFRDAQGMAFHPKTHKLWLIENEPRGGDELNVVDPGKNYGFPLISYGRDNDGKMLNGGLTKQDGLEQPVYYWTPSVAFSGMTFYTGDKLKGWKNNIFAGGLSGQQLVRLEMSKDGRVIGEEKLLRDRCKRIRDVRQGPDGLLYILTDDANGEILRISPE